MYKILLLFPNFLQYETLKINPHQPSLSLAYLSAMLEKENIEHVICDAAADNIGNEKLVSIVYEIQPEFVGITTNIAIIQSAIYSAKIIKEHFPQIKIIMGGPWAHVNYEFLLKKKIADIVCFGEGEYTLANIMKNYKDSLQDISQIERLAYFDGTKIIKTEKRQFIEDLDLLPFPNWKRFPLKKYQVNHRYSSFIPMMTVRGCPYNCINCSKDIHGYKPRFRSIENIITELDYIKKEINPEEIVIMDDVFNINLDRAKQILRAIIKRNYNFKFLFLNGLRADKFDLEFALLLRTAGTYRVALGVESGSQKVIKFLRKSLDLSVVKQTVSYLHKAGITVYGYFMLGLPIENVNSMIHSIDFADKCDFDFAYFNNVLLFPGTELYDYVMKEENESGRAKEINTKHPVNYLYPELGFKSTNYSNKDFKKVKNYLLYRFFLNPRRIVRFIKGLSFREIIYTLKRVFALISFRLLRSGKN